MIRAILIFAVFTAAACDGNVSGRILGGRPAEPREIPYIASLRRSGANPPVLIGAGALISDRWVLTAATALEGATAATTLVIVGMIDSQVPTVAPGHQLAVLTLTRHGNFNNPHLGANDIALVHLAAAVFCAAPFHGSISPIFMPEFRENSPIDVVMSGWGATSQNIGPGSRFLQTKRTRTMNNERCAGFLGSRITFETICTDNPVNMGFCTTDIGGPLVSATGLIGIASFNMPCGQGAPDVYTRVSSYRTWIRTVSGV